MTMAGQCSISHCFADTPCVLGHVDKSECERYVPIAERAHDAHANEAHNVPWNGTTAGTADVAYLASRGRPRIIGVLGPHDAGKTTFLTMFYSLVLGTDSIRNRLVAGSHTLGGWEAIAHHMRWSAEHSPGFPAHTTSYSSRQPGLLHLALREDRGALRDVLFTDAPGEWFTRWAINAETSEAEGARWVADNADVFALFVDSSRFESNSTLGAARNEYYALVERLGSISRGRPVFIVRSKADVTVEEDILAQLRARQVNAIPTAEWRATSESVPETMFDLAADLVDACLSRRDARVDDQADPRLVPDDPFLSFRGE